MTGINLSPDSREIALELLYGILEQGKFSHLLFADIWEKYPGRTKKERAFVTRLTEETLEKVITLDYVINLFSKTKTDKMKPVIRTILRMGACQILFMEVPDSAACNESVKLAGKKGFGGLKGFVNGVLRTIVRNKDSITYPEGKQGLCVRYSMPLWIVEHFEAAYGEEKTIEILSNLKHASDELCVRFLLTRFSEEEITAQLKKEGLTVRPHPFGCGAWLISGIDRVASLTAFQKGMIQVQDFSSMMPVESVRHLLQPGMKVLDVCAAPGGKSLQAADLLRGTGKVLSRDISEKKAAWIKENKIRAGFSNVSVEVWDAAERDDASEEAFDFVLADLPCSGLGILAKKPDIKYNSSRDALHELAELQRRILSTVWRYVKPGGYLVYSTCTMNPGENEENASWFEENFDFIKVKEKQYFPEAGLCDGFYTAVFKRS